MDSTPFPYVVQVDDRLLCARRRKTSDAAA